MENSEDLETSLHAIMTVLCLSDDVAARQTITACSTFVTCALHHAPCQPVQALAVFVVRLCCCAAAVFATGHMLWEVLSGLYPFQQAGQALMTVTQANNVSLAALTTARRSCSMISI